MKIAQLLPICALTGITAWAAIALPKSDDAKTASPEAAEFFENKIRPLLAEKCYSCHGDARQAAGIRLDSRAELLKAGGRGPVVAPGAPDASPLIRAVRYDGKVKMPPAGKLSDAEIASLTAWVKSGAVWPEAKATTAAPTGGQFVLTPEKKNYWAFRPVKRLPAPKVKNVAWVKSPIDAFILAKLEAKGLTPSAPADRRTLLRRVTFDLIGLPPTPEEMDAFLHDKSPKAYEKVVDRLLASPHYGERWGRRWLDVVRYCDSEDARGVGSEGDCAFAYRYRDWVVNALNSDMPYDKFMLNQVAGDLLPPDKPGDLNIPGTIATGMLAIGNWGNGDADKEKILTDIADDQVDVVSRGFMGLTVACARCHHHKFDPIPTQDYYGLAGIFFSTHILPKLTPKGAGENLLRIPLVGPAEMAQRDKFAADMKAMETHIQQVRASRYSELAASLKPQTAAYMIAAYDYRNRPAAQANLSLADFAKSRGLHEFALRQWSDSLGFGDYRLLTVPVRDVLGTPGVVGYHSPLSDPPSITVNENKEAKQLLTFTLPPRSVSVHPGQTNGVAVAWQSPIAGTMRVTGRVIDADPACGNGIAWVIQHRTPGGAKALANGEFPNGGKQDFAEGKGAENLNAVEVKAGESIELLVLPNGDYSCDTTVVELTLTDATTKRAWNLRDDIVEDLHKGNPHPDRFGNLGVWRFEDMAGGAASASPLLADWKRAVADVAGGKADRSALEVAANGFAKGFDANGKDSPFRIASRADESALPAEARTELAKLQSDLEAMQKRTPPAIEYANGAQDGGCPESPQAGIHDIRVHIRGNYARLAELVPRHFPIVLAGEKQPPITKGSGRLELGEWLGNPNHPTTSRVIVNRLWQGHFGEGIVRTPSNFGILGERPSHPELLDWLASELVRNGWSLKKIHREILLSATYRQSSVPPPANLKIDPDNRLFGRMSRRRLESEAVRDNLLAVAGNLDLTMGGLATRDFSAPRRTMYIMTIRSDRTGFGPLFDVADSTASVERRANSTVAPQALFLLNDPFVLMQTKTLAKRLLTEVKGDDAARIGRAYELLYGRPPSAEEVQIGLSYLNRARKTLTARVAGPGAPNINVMAWEAYCQILLCANEFIYTD